MVVLVIPSIIYVANQRLLFDDLETYRKDHQHGIARLGGVAIFCSFTISTLIFSKLGDYVIDNYLLTSAIILFAVGLKDDLCGVNARTKFIMQFIIACIMVLFSGVRITSFYGLFNIYELSVPFSIVFSIVAIMFVINSFNLIDGIDGLAGTMGLVINLVLGVAFIVLDEVELACISFAMVGATLAFLKYNLTPAKIFLGDTGSLLIGFISIISAIKFVELNKGSGETQIIFSSAPSIAVAMFIGPIFDAFRVFVLRILNNGSPFTADRNHIHHRLLRLGLSHLQATLLLISVKLVMIAGTLLLTEWAINATIILLVLIYILLDSVLTILIRAREGRQFLPAAIQIRAEAGR